MGCAHSQLYTLTRPQPPKWEIINTHQSNREVLTSASELSLVLSYLLVHKDWLCYTVASGKNLSGVSAVKDSTVWFSSFLTFHQVYDKKRVYLVQIWMVHIMMKAQEINVLPPQAPHETCCCGRYWHVRKCLYICYRHFSLNPE